MQRAKQNHRHIWQGISPLFFVPVEDRSPEEDLSQAVNCSQNHFQLAPSPVDVDKLHVYAHGYDNILIQKVVDGFKHGFPICYTGPRVFREAKNLKSAVSSPDIIKHLAIIIYKDLYL